MHEPRPVRRKTTEPAPLIAVDIRANHDTGVARYGRSVLAATAPLAARHGIKLLAIVRPGHEQTAAAALAHGHQVLAIDADEGFIRDNPRLRAELATRRVDLYYTSHYTVDRRCPVPFTFTIHDLTRWRMPHLSYTEQSFAARFGVDELARLRTELEGLAPYDLHDPAAGEFTRYFTALSIDLAARARRLTTVSPATAADIHTLLGVGTDRLDMVPCGVDTQTFRPRPAVETSRVLAAHGLADGPYLVFVGLAHPNKRFAWLVRHLAAARRLLPPGTRLAAVGGHAEQLPEVRSLLKDLDAEDFIAFTGRVSDDDLAALYTGAAAWVTASVNEGNNLPPLEALACGSEVLATDITPLRDSLGGHAHYYPPDDASALIDSATALLKGRADRLQPGYRAPSWEEAGHLLLRSWRRALSSTGRDA